MERKVWKYSMECKVRSVECGVWSVEGVGYSVAWRVGSVKCGVWSVEVKCGVVKCGVESV